MNKGLIIGIIISILVIGGGALFLSRKKGNAAKNSTVLGTNSTTQSSDKSISLSEVAKHSNSSSCWIAIEGNVYDVTSFISQHPGGNRILQGCGKDGTALFNGAGGHIHSQAARALLKKYKIGVLSN